MVEKRNQPTQREEKKKKRILLTSLSSPQLLRNDPPPSSSPKQEPATSHENIPSPLPEKNKFEHSFEGLLLDTENDTDDTAAVTSKASTKNLKLQQTLYEEDISFLYSFIDSKNHKEKLGNLEKE